MAVFREPERSIPDKYVSTGSEENRYLQQGIVDVVNSALQNAMTRIAKPARFSLRRKRGRGRRVLQ
jgi:hypothetical protein